MAEPYTDNPAVAAQVRQLLAERENAEAYGQTSRLEAIDKQLQGLGVKPDKKLAKAPEGRASRAKQTTAPKDEE